MDDVDNMDPPTLRFDAGQGRRLPRAAGGFTEIQVRGIVHIQVHHFHNFNFLALSIAG